MIEVSNLQRLIKNTSNPEEIKMLKQQIKKAWRNRRFKKQNLKYEKSGANQGASTFSRSEQELEVDRKINELFEKLF